MNVLVTGATGYVGGRLVPRLLREGCRVRVLVRDARRVEGRPWASQVEMVPGALEDGPSLRRALEGMDVVYYLVHAMLSGKAFDELERRQAQTFVEAATDAQVKHVVYLGGLLPRSGRPSHHLQSRAQVGEILRAHLPATEFRAGPIIGSGSASFEMLRYLTERLPVMVAPRWILNPVSPIAIGDVLSYLLRALSAGPQGIVEIGAPPETFRDMMLTYARLRGLRRVIIPLPVLTPWLAAHWIGLVTPIPNRLAIPLVEGILFPLIADTTRAQVLFPEIKPISCEQAMAMALAHIERGDVETRWSGALFDPGYVLEDTEGMIQEIRSLTIQAPPEAVFQVVTSLGGNRGWLVWEWAWEIRGLLDRLIGGPGLRRGRRHPTELLPGETVDFWRVEALEKPSLLRLRAEMRLPGKAWLEWRVLKTDGNSQLIQTAYFAPRGLLGFLYWWLLYPVHARVFSSLSRAIAQESVRLSQAAGSDP